MKGILVKDRGTILYDSRNVRPQVAVNREPKHLDAPTVTGTALVSAVGNGYYVKETLLDIKHNLTYKPEVLVYFYVIGLEDYAIGKYFYGFGSADDYITYEVDEDSFRIVHILDDTFFNIGLVSSADTVGKIRVKYMIFSNPINAVTNG